MNHPPADHLRNYFFNNMYFNPLAEEKTPERNGFTVFLLVFSIRSR